MKKKILSASLFLLTILTLSGCASSDTAIEHTNKPFDIFITVIVIIVLIIFSYYVGQIQRRRYEKRKKQKADPQFRNAQQKNKKK